MRQQLSDEQVLEIVRLHDRGVKAPRIADQFNRSENTIRSIVLGKTYRGVTGREHKPGRACVCRNCQINRRHEDNLDVAMATEATFRCIACNAPIVRRVAVVQRVRGQVRCTDCDGRRK